MLTSYLKHLLVLSTAPQRTTLIELGKTTKHGGATGLGVLALLSAAAAFAYYASRDSHDIYPYWFASLDMLHGTGELYGPSSGRGWPLTYRSGPLLLFIFLPFALVRLEWAAAAWAFLKVLLLAWLVGRIYRFALVNVPSPKPWWSYAWLPILTCVPYVIGEFGSGNVQFFVFALAAMGFCFLERRPPFAALCFALSIAVKLFPLFFLPYLWLRGDRRVVRLTVLFLIAFLALPSVYFGFWRNIELLRDWLVVGIGDPSPGAWGITPDHSLLGVMHRYFSRIPYESMPETNYANINLLDAPKRLLTFLWAALAGALYLLLLRLSVLARRAQARTRPLEAALLFAALLLLEPVSQRIYFVAVIFPAIVLGVELRHGPPSGRGFLVLVGLAVLLFAVPPLLQVREWLRLMTVYSPDFWGLVLLASALARLLWHRLRTHTSHCVIPPT